jgi:gluconokinase
MNSEKLTKNQPSLIIVMGVSGSGKSHIASKLAASLNFDFIEADDFHSDKSKNNMSANIPLTESVRQFWVEIICHHIKNRSNKNIVLAYSGLKLKHRNMLRKLQSNSQFIWLDGNANVIRERLIKRRNHFVSAEFLSGQLSAMESPDESEKDILKIDIANDVEDILIQCLAALETKSQQCSLT